jgi:hypothetical protein
MGVVAGEGVCRGGAHRRGLGRVFVHGKGPHSNLLARLGHGELHRASLKRAHREEPSIAKAAASGPFLRGPASAADRLETALRRGGLAPQPQGGASDRRPARARRPLGAVRPRDPPPVCSAFVAEPLLKARPHLAPKARMPHSQRSRPCPHGPLFGSAWRAEKNPGARPFAQAQRCFPQNRTAGKNSAAQSHVRLGRIRPPALQA